MRTWLRSWWWVIVLGAIGVSIAAVFLLTGQKAEQAAERAIEAEQTIRELERRIIERFHTDRITTEFLTREIIREFNRMREPNGTQAPTRSPASTVPPPPGPGGTVPTQGPVPTEPGGEAGTLLPILCNNGLGDDFNLDCSPDAPPASMQILCQLGFDAYLQLDCGKGDVDGAETPVPTQ